MKKLLTVLVGLVLGLPAYAQREVLLTKGEFTQQLRVFSAGASGRYVYDEQLEEIAQAKSVYYCHGKDRQHCQLPTTAERMLLNGMDTTGLAYREFYFRSRYKKSQSDKHYLPGQLSRQLNQLFRQEGALRTLLADSTYCRMAYYTSFDGLSFHTTFLIASAPVTDADLNVASIDNPQTMLALLNQYRNKRLIPNEPHVPYPKAAPLQYHPDLEKAAKIQAIHLMNDYSYEDVLRIKKGLIQQYGRQAGIKKARLLTHSHPRYLHSIDRVKAATPQTHVAFSSEEVFRWDHYEANMESVAMRALSTSPDHYRGMMDQQFTHMGSYSVYDARKGQYVAVIVMGYLYDGKPVASSQP